MVAAVGPHFLITLPRAWATQLGAPACYCKGRNKNSRHPGGGGSLALLGMCPGLEPLFFGWWEVSVGTVIWRSPCSPVPPNPLPPAHCTGRVCEMPPFWGAEGFWKTEGGGKGKKAWKANAPSKGQVGTQGSQLLVQ